LSSPAHGIGFGKRADIEHDGSFFLFWRRGELRDPRRSWLASERGGPVNTYVD
jgi:hypothetical protein